MGKKRARIEINQEGGELASNPFASLDSDRFADGPKRPGPANTSAKPKPVKAHRGRVDVVRQRSAGGGGWVTVAKNFVGISDSEKTALRKEIQKQYGVGGTLRAGAIEIRGDKREEVRRVLESAGFRVVYAGG